MSNEGLLLYPADTDFPASAYAVWAATATAITATPTAGLQANGWASDDLVRVDEINGAMKSTQDWMQFVYDTNQATGGAGLRSEYFGSGVDGDVTISAPTTLTRDMFYGQLTIDPGGYINTAGYRIYASAGVDLSTADAGAIRFDGASGANGTTSGATGIGGAGGAAVAGNFLALSGQAGGYSYDDLFPNDTPALSTLPRAYIASYVGPVRHGGDGGGVRSDYFAYTTVSRYVGSRGGASYNGELLHRPLVDHATGAMRSKLISGGLSGGGGGAGTANIAGFGGGGGGGGGGGSGGFIFIGARYITLDPAQPAGTIRAIGGDGGNGVSGPSEVGGSGGGGGGSGGTVVVVCEAVYLNTGDNLSQGVADVIDVSGGAGGDGGVAGTGGTRYYAGCGGDGGNGGVVLILRTGIDPDNTLGIERMTWAPSTAMGADGEQVNYGSTENVVKAGGAGGVWKVAL